MSFLPSIFSRKRAPKAKRPVVLRLEYLEERCTPSVTVTRTSDSATFTSIQAAINDAGTGTGTILQVSAGTDAESVTINKSITLEGAQHGVDARTGRPSASETIVEPGLTSSFDTDSVFVVTANNVTIDGFTIQGSIANPPVGQSAGFTLTSGTTVYAAAGISNSTNVNNGGFGGATTDITGLTVQNNIVQHFTQAGVYGDTNGGTLSTGNTITDNLIRDVPENGPTYHGNGVLIQDNFYAHVTDNQLTSVRTGIQASTFYLSAGVYAPSISNNTVSASVRGVYFNNLGDFAPGGPPATFTVSDNTITQADATVSPAYNVGLLIQSIQSSATANITGNDVSGFLYGVEFAGNDTTNTITVQGGVLNANTYGVWDTNNDYNFPATYNTTAALDGVAVTNSKTAGIWVDSTSPDKNGNFNTTNSTTLSILDGTTVTGGPIGLLVDGALSLASLKQSTISRNTTGVSIENGGALTSATQNVITGNTTGIAVASGAGTIGPIFDNDLSGNTTVAIANASGVLIDASLNWWGVATSAGVRAKISGMVDYTPFLVSGADTDATTLGFQGDFMVLDVDAASAQVGSTGRIQEGVNDVLAGGTVNVLAGTYAENVTINKNLTLAGVSGNPTAAVIHPTTNAGDGVTIAAEATDVTVQDLEITGANNGVNASGLTTLNLSDLTLTGNAAGGTISNVTTVNETPSSGATPTNVVATALSFVSDMNQAVSLSGILNFVINGGSGSDTFNVTPSSGTTFTVHGNAPTPPALPGDELTVPSGGTLTDTFNSNTGYFGMWTFAGMEPVNFDGIESLAPATDLSINAAGPAAPVAGDPNGFNYTLTVTNNGLSDNTGGFTVTDTLPAGVTFQAAGSTPGAVVNGQTITYTNSTGLANGATQTFVLHVTVAASVPPGTVLQDNATVTPAAGGAIDPNPANNSSSVSSTVLPPTADLSISVAGPAAPIAGDPNGFDYTLTVTNNGPLDNTGGFTVTDVLPAGVTFQAAGSTPGAVVNGQTITYTNSTGLTSGSTQTFTLHVTVAASVPPSVVLQDSATVTPAAGATIDPNPANNSFSFSSTVAAAPPPPFVSVAFGPNGEVVEVVNFEGVLTQFDATGAHQLGNGGVRTASVAFGPNGEVLEVVGLNGILMQFDASGAHQLGGAGVQSASIAFGPGGEVLEVVLVDGSLTQFDAAGAHPLGTGGVQSASVAFGPGGEVLEVINTLGVLTQFTAAGAQQLGGAGVRSAGVAFTSIGEVLDIIFTDGTLDQFDAFGVHRLGVVS